MKTKTDQIFELSAPYNNECQGPAFRALFVCSAGLLRSATAATVAAKMGMNARSCGSHNYALIPLSVNLINWATRIYFVNEENSYRAMETFESDKGTIEMIKDKMVVWDIPDHYNYGDPWLMGRIVDLLS